jgi:hypothetical protein
VDVADRLGLRDLVERYAQAVDAKDVDTVVGLFTGDGRLVSHIPPGTDESPLEQQGHEQLHRALELGLARYRATTHMIGGQVVEADGDGATGVTVCRAHHLYDSRRNGSEGGSRMLVMALRYHDRYVRSAAGWRFAERLLRLDWLEDRPFGDRP